MVMDALSACLNSKFIRLGVQKSLFQRASNIIKKIFIGPTASYLYRRLGLSARYKILNTNAYSIGHLCVDIDCFLKESHLNSFGFKGVLLADRKYCSNVFLCKLWANSSSLVVVESSLLCFLLDYLRIYPETSFDCSKYCALDGQPATVYEIYSNYGNDNPIIKWDQSTLAEATKLFNREFPGLDISRVVVLHSRDSIYDQTVQNENMNTQNYRNSQIGSFKKIIDFLNKKDYAMIRIGKYDRSSQMEKIIAIKSEGLTSYEEQMLDVYLSSKCALFVGSASGASNLASIWNVPVFLLNILPYALLRPHSRKSMAIPKLLKKNGKVLSAKEIFQKKYHWFRTDQLYEAAGIEIKINDSEDCLDDFKEFFRAFVDNNLEMEAILKGSEVKDLYQKDCANDSYDYYANSFVPRCFLKKNNII
jgi:putative glycosyltransferase (TIGR04372 family)